MAVVSPVGAVRVGPAVIRRRCQVRADTLESLGSDAVWSAAGHLAVAVDECLRLGAALADRIGERIPETGAAERRALLHARRNAFNGRPLDEEPDVEGVGAYQDALAVCHQRRAQLARHDAELAASTRATLLQSLSDADFAGSVELSVPGLVRQVPAALSRDSAKARRRTLTLYRLLTRAATKPSPFARLADSTILLPGAAEEPVRSHVRIDRKALDWVQHWVRAGGLRALPAERVWVTTNSSATLTPGRVSWLAGRGVRGAACSAGLADLLTRLRTPVRLAELHSGGVVAELVENELLEIGLRLPGWGRDTLAVAAAAVDADDENAREIHDALVALHELESTAEPGAVVNRAGAGLRRLAAACGVRDTGPHRVLVSEDRVGVAGDPGPRWDADVLADLGRLQRVAPLFGPELPFHLAGAISFGEQFGDVAVPLLTAFRWFLQAGRQSADQLITESTHPVLAGVLAVRTEMIRGLERLRTDAAGAEEVSVGPGWLDDLAAAMPPEVPEWPCVSWPVQEAGDRLVLNGIGSGYGRFAARIAATLTEPQRRQVRTWIADVAGSWTLPVDIAVRFGATVNEHPLLLPAALAYPGNALDCEPATRIDMASVTLRMEDGRLVARSADFPGRRLLFLPHNATLPSLAPPLYRWLSRLGPPPGSTLALWDLVDSAVDSAAGDPGVRCYPRLSTGRLVLCRRTWKVPGDALPDGDVVAWRRWSDRTGVPRRSFLRTTTLPDPWDVMRGLATAHRVGAARAPGGAAVRKPSYVDLSQPLARPAKDGDPTARLTFTEPLPDPARSAPDGHVTEYVIETAPVKTVP
ncbi:lantibiotic dehydratase [Nonomuraea sp. NPDC047897]|uniref:lantibiotic dehydratase n=1 Tax=Nonomuraea sp. NPDC047897 TaxID=3364346 RepID=UPI00372153FC